MGILAPMFRRLPQLDSLSITSVTLFAAYLTAVFLI
jgi:hypothetical protein